MSRFFFLFFFSPSPPYPFAGSPFSPASLYGGGGGGPAPAAEEARPSGGRARARPHEGRATTPATAAPASGGAPRPEQRRRRGSIHGAAVVRRRFGGVSASLGRWCRGCSTRGGGASRRSGNGVRARGEARRRRRSGQRAEEERVARQWRPCRPPRSRARGLRPCARAPKWRGGSRAEEEGVAGGPDDGAIGGPGQLLDEFLPGVVAAWRAGRRPSPPLLAPMARRGRARTNAGPEELPWSGVHGLRLLCSLPFSLLLSAMACGATSTEDEDAQAPPGTYRMLVRPVKAPDASVSCTF